MEQPKKENSSLPKMNPLLKALNGSPEEWAQFLGEKTQVENTERQKNPFDSTLGVADTAIMDKRYSKIYRDAGLNASYQSYDDLEKGAYLNQTFGEQVGATIKGGAKLFAAGALDYLGSNYDAEGIYNMAMGNSEGEFGNWLTDITSQMRDSAMEENPIFQNGSMWNTNYWAQHIQQANYSVGLLFTGAIEQGLLAATTGGVGNAASLGLKAKNAFSLGRNALFGMRGALGEAYINGLDTAKEVKQKYINLGFSEEEANDKAAKAATAGFRLEVGPMMILNAVTHMALFGGGIGKAFTKQQGIEFGASGLAENTLGRLVPNTLAGRIGTTVGSEAFEEMYQGGVARYVSDEKVFSEDMIHEGIGGAVGALMLGGTANVFKRLAGNTAAEKKLNESKQQFVDDSAKRTAQIIKQKADIQNEYKIAVDNFENEKTAENRKALELAEQKLKANSYNSYLHATLEALELDNLTGDTRGFDEHMKNMQEILDATQDLGNPENVEILKRHGILNKDGQEDFKGSIEEIQETFPSNIKKSEALRDSLASNLENITSDFNSARAITEKEYNNIWLIEQANRVENDLLTTYNTDTQFNLLSPEGQSRFKLEAELDAIQGAQHMSSTLQEREAEIQAELAEVPDYNTRDKRTLGSVNKNPFVNANISINSYNQAIDANNQDLVELRDPKKIEEKVNKRREEAVEKAKSVRELRKAVREAQKKNKKDAKLEAKAKKKEAEIVAKEIIKQDNPEYTPTEVANPEDVNDVVEGSKEKDEATADAMASFSAMFNSGALVSQGEEFTPTSTQRPTDNLNQTDNSLKSQKADIEKRRKKELEYATFELRQEELKQGRKNTSEIVNIIKNKYSNKTLIGKIIRLLENLIDFQKFATVRVENLKGGTASGQAMNGGMVLDSLTYDSILEGDSKAIKTFIHEVIHHLLDATKWTSHKRDPKNSDLSGKEIKAWENLERIFEKVKSISKTKAYGLTNLNEFLAEAFSNESFQRDLSEIKGEGKKPNLLEDILNNIVEILQEQLNKWGERFNKEVPSLSNSILEDIFAWSEDLINIDRKIADASLVEEINAKYDAEIAALESTLEFTPSESVNEDGTQLFSPREITNNQKAKDRVQETTQVVADNLDRELGRPATFDDFVRDFIEKESYESVEKLFDVFKYGWESIGRDTTEAERVRNKYFNSRKAMLDAYIAFDAESLGVERDNILEQNPITRESVEKEDPNRTSNIEPKLAVLGVSYEEVKGPDGVYRKKTNSFNLNKTPGIDNHIVLDPDAMKEGTKLKAVVLSGPELLSTKVTKWDYNEKEGRLEGKTVAFKDLGLTPGTDEWINKVPILLEDENGNSVAYIHDADWYTPNNVKGEGAEHTKQLIQEGREKLFNIRKNILEGNTTIEVTSKTFGQIFETNAVQDNHIIPLSEATGDTKLAIATGFTELKDFDVASGPLQSRMKLLNKTSFERGNLYEVRHVFTEKDGTKVYLALPVITNIVSKGQPINDTAFNNVKFATIAAMILTNPNNKTLLDTIEGKYGMTLSKAQAIRQAIMSSTGPQRIDINSEIGKYIEMFTKVGNSNTDFLAKLENNSLNSKGDEKYPTGGTYVNYDNGILKIAVKDGNPVPRNEKGYDEIRGLYFGGKVGTQPVMDFLETAFGDNGTFRNVPFSQSLKQLGANREFISIDETGNIVPFTGTRGENTYDAYIKDNVSTNVKSFEIENPDTGETKWITDIQPQIFYKVSEKETQVEEKHELAPEVALEAKGVEQQSSALIENTEVKSVEALLDKLPDALRDAMSDNIKDIMSSDLDQIDYGMYSRRELDSLLGEALDNIESNQISSLNPMEQKVLVNSLFHNILEDTNIRNGSVNLSEVASRIDRSIETYLVPKIEEYKSIVQQLKDIDANEYGVIIAKYNSVISKLETVVSEKDKIVSRGKDSSKGSLFVKFERFFSEEIAESEDIIEDDNGEIDWSYSKSALEKDVKLSFSSNLKIFFSGIKKKNPENGKDRVNFAKLNDYEEVDSVIEYLTDVMVGIPSSLDALKDALRKKSSRPIYAQILEKIENSSEDVQNEILYKMIQSKLDTYMVMFSMKDGATSLRIFNSNSNEVKVKTRLQWRSNFVNSELFKTVNEDRVYDKDKVKNLIDRIEQTSKMDLESNEALVETKEILSTLGIELSDNSIKLLMEGKKEFYQGKGLLGVMGSSLQNILNANTTVENIDVSQSENDPYNNARGVVNQAIDTETELNGTRVSKSFRDGDKSIQGAIQKMMVYDVKEGLKDPNSQFFKDLQQIPYSQRNFVLELLGESEKFRNNFDLGFISLTAIKQEKQKIYDDRKINKLSETDNMLTELAFFQDKSRDLEGIHSKQHPNLSFRMGRMFSPALSDKDQMILFNTALVDFNYKDVDLETGEVNPSIINLLVDQLFNTEFDRIVETYTNPVDIKDYNSAGKRFLGIPRFNTIEIEDGNGNKTNIHALLKASLTGNGADVETIRTKVLPQAAEIIQDLINSEVKGKINKTPKGMQGSWVQAGFLSLDEEGNPVTKFFDSQYLKRLASGNNKLSPMDRANLAAYDFVINNLLHQNNVFQLFAGDMALYNPGIGKFTNEVTGEIDNVAFSRAIGENISKRLAMLIAPGSKLANSDGDIYTQIFVNDPIKIASTAREFLKQYYGEVSEDNNKLLEDLNNIENNIRNLYKSRREFSDFDNRLEELNKNRGNILKSLKKKNKDIAGYFDIEGTDAQEYTTWKEHLDILFRQGRLSIEERTLVKSAYEKLSKGEDVNPQELQVIMNPIKPVYTGGVTALNSNGKPSVNRITYIKSSSIPLLPQLTKDFKLDAVRQKMESLEAKKGQNVRLSYQTANKVGALNTKLSVNDLYNIPFEDLYNQTDEGVTSGLLAESSLELPRNNFRIQQDTPYKTAKFLAKHEDDMTTMGSQMWKLILGNGVNKIEEKIFPDLFGQEFIDHVNIHFDPSEQIFIDNDMISGKDLDKIKYEAEKDYFTLQQELLHYELGLDETGRIADVNETLQSLHDLLKSEVVTRGYPDNMIDSISLLEDAKGDLSFLTPVWLTANSNKFESLLQAIITNRLIRINLPGNQHISTSSEGFEKVTSLDEISNDIKSQIVWVNPNHKGELKATFTNNGRVKESEILIQSKYRITTKDADGKRVTKLIDLTSDEYSKEVDGFRILDLTKIDKELLSHFSFRIPTSSHQSGAILKVVGFLPEASGDMLVVPKEHTQQLGEDYDIDKRTLYKSNYYVNKEGKIKKLRFTELENTEEYDQFIASMGDDEFGDYSRKIFKSEEMKQKAFQIKRLENIMVDVYKSVYTSPSDSIQKRINKILSFDNATQTAGLIFDRINSSQDDTNFTILSDDYQRAQMKLGADGKTGIGGHSNAVTFQSQLERLHEPVVIQKGVAVGKDIEYVPSTVTIGNFTSDGTLGRVATLDGERNIGDVHTENQNSATDNIKAQIMGKRNENTYTMSVLIQLTLRGFDMVPFTPRKEGDPTSVQMPSLFIAQPILRRYVELMEQSKSVTSEFGSGSEVTVINKLIEEFGKDIDTEYTGMSTNIFSKEADYNQYSEMMTGDALYDNLLEETTTPGIQIAVLQKFLQLRDEAIKLNKVQQLINLSTSGLGISYFNVIERIKTLKSISDNTDFKNIKGLIGDFYDTTSPTFDLEKIPFNEDMTHFGHLAIMPKTSEGVVLLKSLKSAESIMDIIFPYANGYIDSAYTRLSQTLGPNPSKKKVQALQFDIISGMRDFIYSSAELGLFEGSVIAERERLFFDRPGKQSLASYLSSMAKGKKIPLMYSNELLKSFKYDGINNNGAPSIIKHTSDQNSNFDKTDKYLSFLELIQDDKTKLPLFNGEEMTPRKLAQDLASYAMLANNEGGAIGFRDYIHMDYLNAIGVSNSLNTVNSPMSDNTVWNEAVVGGFVTQFMQHNPEYAPIISVDNFSEDHLNIDDSLNKEARDYIETLGGEQADLKPAQLSRLMYLLTEFVLNDQSPYADSSWLALRDTTKTLTDNQYKLFNFDVDSGTYKEVPTLGTHGFNEYIYGAQYVDSGIYPNRVKHTHSKSQYDFAIGTNQPKLGDTENAINEAQALLEDMITDGSKYAKVAELLIPYTDENLKVEFTDEVSTSRPNASGMFDPKTNTIKIHNKLVQGVTDGNIAKEIKEEVILEEILHGLTVDLLKQYGSMQNGQYVPNDDAPVFVTRLAQLYKVAKENIGEDEYYMKDIYEFVAGAVVSDEFKDKLNNTVVSGKSLYDRFLTAIKALTRFIGGESYSDEVVNNMFQLLESRNKPNTIQEIRTQSILDKMRNRDVSIDNLINSTIVKRSIIPTKDKGINLYTATSFEPMIAATVAREFLEGKPIIVHNVKDRIGRNAETSFMKMVIAGVEKYKDPNKTVAESIISETLDNGLVKITFKNPAKLAEANRSRTLLTAETSGYDGDSLKALSKDFKNKVWTNTITHSEGSKTNALKADEFITLEEFITFNVLRDNYREISKPAEGENKGDYNNRLNSVALAQLRNLYNTSEEALINPTQVTNLKGENTVVSKDDITTYETEVGETKYITDKKGDMEMIKEEKPVKEIKTPEQKVEVPVIPEVKETKPMTFEEMMKSGVIGSSGEEGNFSPREIPTRKFNFPKIKEC